MLEFMAEGQWCAVVPASVVAEYLTIGLMIFSSCRDLIDHPLFRKLHDPSNGASEVAIATAFPGIRGAHVVGLTSRKTLQTIAWRLFPPVAIRSGSSLA